MDNEALAGRDDDLFAELDDLTRDDLAKLIDVLGEWTQHHLGISSHPHGVRLFLELLQDRGLDVVRHDTPAPYGLPGTPPGRR